MVQIIACFHSFPLAKITGQTISWLQMKSVLIFQIFTFLANGNLHDINSYLNFLNTTNLQITEQNNSIIEMPLFYFVFSLYHSVLYMFMVCPLGSVCGQDFIQRLYTMMNVISRSEMVYIFSIILRHERGCCIQYCTFTSCPCVCVN